MSRFRNLEFDADRRAQHAAAPVAKDEAYYAGEAQRAFEAGRFEEGLRAYAKVLEHNPGNAVAWAGQVRMLIELGEYREARLWADKALESLPDEPELLAAKAVALARSGDTAAAIAFSDAAIEERGGTPYVWLARADVLLARGERTADYCVEKALALASFQWFYLWLAARVHAFHKRFARALQLAEQALESASDRAVVWLQLGECRMELGLPGPARAAFEIALQLDPECRAADRALHRRGAGVGARLRGWWRRRFGS